jgi:hypothetical protein
MLSRSDIHELSGDVRKRFGDAGADFLLDRTLAAMNETTLLLEEDCTLLSSIPVVDVLTNLPYDPADTVYVIWRADRPSNFWTQARKDLYLAHLRARAAEHGGHLNQTRVMVFDDADPLDIATSHNIMPNDHFYHSLYPMHHEGTFYSLPRRATADYPLVASLAFGYTLSPTHGYAVIPIPFAEDLRPVDVGTEQVASFLAHHADYNEADGPMRAVLTVNPDFIHSLLGQTLALLADHRALAL